MPISIDEIREHYEQFGFDDISIMSTLEYKHVLTAGALFWIDHHGFMRSKLSGEIFASNREQLDALIVYLQSYRNRMSMP